MSHTLSVIEFSKCRNSAIIPTRGTPGSAGLDLYIPAIDLRSDEADYHQYLNEFRYHNGLPDEVNTRALIMTDSSGARCIRVLPHSQVYIPIGIRVKMPEGSALIAFNKSGVSYKQSLARLSCVIDEDYQGEIGSTLFNYSSNSIELKFGQKLVQVVRIPVFFDSVCEVENDKLYEVNTIRGSGKMGSTGV